MVLGAVDGVHDPRRVWLSIEAFLAYGSANRRARVGLCERVVAHRYLLVAVFGIFQTFACITDIWLAQAYVTDRIIDDWTDLTLGALD